MTKLIGYERSKYDYEIRQELIAKFKALPENEQKSLYVKEEFQNQYKLALAQLQVEKAKRDKERFENNLNAFLEDPKGAIAELNEECHRCFDLGELLISYGIAKTTIKRYGKGALVHKGTLAEHISSNFKVTAKIGDETLEMELASSNDKRDKDRSMAHVAAILANKIANKS